jgi:hypothetical protein
MIDDLAAGLAVDPAATELGIERVQLVRAQRAGLLAADERPDVLVEVALVHQVRTGADVEHLEVTIEELIHGGSRPRVPALVDLVQHPDPSDLRLCACTWARLDDLDEVVALACDSVDTGIDAHPIGAARQQIDAAASPLARGQSTRHATRVRNIRVMNRVTTRWR